ncbi:group II intron reverse transcriptase/maturase [Spirosoma foliorum]|uniref:Group II intron reverse transcriptase/maturase n=2 Tax=Spirosoma foliorum TaxID=2710596 RepID=A0A7G5H7C9_9BACT|nr:group II intron reverse transcriptase/maturase [Spirosoma foliorum]
MEEWKDTPWRKLERYVFRLQKRIFKASQRDDVRTVRRLQKTLIRSQSAKTLAVRQVTQDNQGKKTAGLDGVKSLSPPQRLALVTTLKMPAKATPTRRVWIPKPGSQEKRPLGIPILYDRALQALAKKALEPEWEARFEANSYGFRLGRGAHDAIQAIFSAICNKTRYVLDADIAKCFDRINHQALLAKLSTFPTLRRQIKSWLKAGVMEGDQLFPTEEGSPQGGVISPLLANIALHGMEQAIHQAFPTQTRKVNGVLTRQTTPHIVRYADDFIILHEELAVVEQCKGLVSDWLAPMGLKLKESKTSITHTLYAHEGKIGFDFLGFTIRQFPVGKHHSGLDNKRSPLGFKTLIQPSVVAIKRHSQRLNTIIRRHRSSQQQLLIDELNPVIRGWSNYYSTVVSKKHYCRLTHLLFRKLWRWASRRHPRKGAYWLRKRYWPFQDKSWRFADKGKALFQHSDTRIVRHVKVIGSRSPFDGNWVYWSSRMGRHPEVGTRLGFLLKRQKGQCTHCKLFFKHGDLLEVDHQQPRSAGGSDRYENLQLLHRHCHDVKTATDQQDKLQEDTIKG